MRAFRILGLAGVGLLVLAAGARADDQPFLTVYTTDIDSAQEKELEQSLYWNSGKPGQAFNGLLSRTEIEYGVTDDFQVSLYGNYGWEQTHPHAPLAPVQTTRDFSVSGEAIYRFLNVYFDPIGMAVYLEPSYGDKSRELEAKILLQKNFFNDKLRLAANLNFENQWNRGAGSWEKESAIELFAGASYNITPEISAGVEFNNENDFDGLVGSSEIQSHVYYFGPTVQYVGLPLTVTLGAQFQLPWANDPTHTPGAIRNGFSTDAERVRVGMRVSMDVP